MNAMKARGPHLPVAVSCLGIMTILATGWLLKDQAVAQWYLRKLEDRCAEDRGLAARQLVNYPFERVFVALLKSAVNDPDPGVREASNESAGIIFDGPQGERILAREALAIPLLVAAMDEESFIPRWVARSWESILAMDTWNGLSLPPLKIAG